MFLNLLAGGTTLAAQVAAILRTYGTDAHVYLPGIGVINGLTAGNYLDSAGTTAATVDNPVGLVLDGAGTTARALTIGSTTVGAVGAGNLAIGSSIPVVAGRAYRITYTITACVGQLSASLLGQVNGTAQAVNFTGTYSEVLFATASATIPVGLMARGVGITSVTGSLFVDEVTGIHATQATTANKPILRRGAVNLALQSNSVSTSPWSMLQATASGNTITSNTTGVANPRTQQLISSIASGSVVTLIVEVANGTSNNIAIGVHNGGGGNIAGGKFNLSGAGSVLLSSSSINTIEQISGGYRIKCIFTTATATPYFYAGPDDGSSLANSFPYTTVSGLSVIINKFGVVAGNYSGSEFPVTTTAPASSSTGNYWWQFDGSNDSLALGSVPFQATDNYAIIAGAKVSDAAGRAIFSVSSGTSNDLTVLGYTGGSVWLYSKVGGIGQTPTSSPIYANTDIVATGRHTTGSIEVRVNGVQKASASDATIAASSYTLATIGAYYSSAGFYLGSISPVIVIKGTVTNADLLILEKFVGLLSGVTI